MSEGKPTVVAASRLDLVRRRAERWADTLVDLTPNNPLLHLRDRSASALDLSSATPEGLGRLLNGQTTRLGDAQRRSPNPVSAEEIATLTRTCSYATSGP
jgi:hypothetical protein